MQLLLSNGVETAPMLEVVAAKVGGWSKKRGMLS